MGRTAYYARRMGIEDYTIVDLPITGVAHSYHLGRIFGAEALHLHGQPGDTTSHRVKIMPPEWLFQSGDKFDVIMNAGSLTEMYMPTSHKYLRYISGHCKGFLSINHEVDAYAVGNILRTLPGRYTRHVCWMREGYAEEVFIPDTKPSTEALSPSDDGRGVSSVANDRLKRASTYIFRKR